MTDDINKDGGNGKLESEKPKDVTITIKLSPGGQLAVQGPGNGQLYDVPMIIYLLDAAKDHIKAVNRQVGQSRIVQARPRIGDIFRRK